MSAFQFRLPRFAAYVNAGAVGTLAQYGVLSALVLSSTSGAVVASGLGAITGAVVNYILNYRFVFRTTASHRKTAPCFFAVAATGIALNSALMFTLIHRFALGWLAAQCVATACVLIFGYGANSLWTFRADKTQTLRPPTQLKLRYPKFTMPEITRARPAAAEVTLPDGGHARRLIWLLPVHAIVWTIAAWLSRGNLDTQGDMVENYVWGVEWQAGYAKHPPLFAWLTALWFRVFPHTDIAYFALSALNAMTGLLGIVAFSSQFVTRRLAVIAGMAMAVSPLYSTLAIKFNANSVLLSVWPWTAYFFVRYMHTRSRRMAIAFGALAAVAVLGKYFSVVLLTALLLASLARPAWRTCLSGRHVLLVVAAGVAVLAPHIHWLVVNHFPTFAYAHERTDGTSLAAVARFGIYTLAQMGYLAPSFVVTLLLVHGQRAQAARLMARSVVKPSLCPDLWWLTLAPLIVEGIIAVLSGTQMASVWGMAQWFAIVPLWLVVLDRAGFLLRPERGVPVLACYWLIVLAAACATGYVGALHNTDDAAEPRAELARAAHALWNQRFQQPIPVVAGSGHEARSIAFYSDGHTRYWDMFDPNATPWLRLADLEQRGALFVCEERDVSCIQASGKLTRGLPVRLAVSRHAWGRALPARNYLLFVLAPAH